MKFRSRNIPEGINVTPTHPLKEFFVLLGGAIALVIVLFYSLGWIAGWLSVKLPPAYEKKIGTFFNWSGEKKNKDASEAFKKAETYIQSVQDKLTGSLKEKPFPYKVSIQCTPAINAFAFPGGNTVIFSGLLERMKSEEELAFLLGHELGHHLHRDHLRQMGRGLVFMSLFVLLGFSDQGGPLMKVVHSTTDIMSLSFSREQEISADDEGLKFVTLHYGKPATGLELFDTMESAGNKYAENMPNFMLTHPHSEDRHQRLLAVLRDREPVLTTQRTKFPEKGIFQNICKYPEKQKK